MRISIYVLLALAVAIPLYDAFPHNLIQSLHNYTMWKRASSGAGGSASVKTEAKASASVKASASFKAMASASASVVARIKAEIKIAITVNPVGGFIEKVPKCPIVKKPPKITPCIACCVVCCVSCKPPPPPPPPPPKVPKVKFESKAKIEIKMKAKITFYYYIEIWASVSVCKIMPCGATLKPGCYSIPSNEGIPSTCTKPKPPCDPCNGAFFDNQVRQVCSLNGFCGASTQVVETKFKASIKMFASAMTSSAGFAAQWTASITTKATMIIKSKQTHKCMQEVDEGKTITVYKWWRFSWTSSESCVVIGCRPKKVQICNCYVVHPTCNPTLTVPRPGACKTPKPPCGVCTKGYWEKEDKIRCRFSDICAVASTKMTMKKVGQSEIPSVVGRFKRCYSAGGKCQKYFKVGVVIIGEALAKGECLVPLGLSADIQTDFAIAGMGIAGVPLSVAAKIKASLKVVGGGIFHDVQDKGKPDTDPGTMKPHPDREEEKNIKCGGGMKIVPKCSCCQVPPAQIDEGSTGPVKADASLYMSAKFEAVMMEKYGARADKDNDYLMRSGRKDGLGSAIKLKPHWKCLALILSTCALIK